MIFILIFIFANSPLGIRVIPCPWYIHTGVHIIGGSINYETNPIFYLTDEISRAAALPKELPTWFPFIFYWYFLSLVITFLLYKSKSYKIPVKLQKFYFLLLIFIIVGVVGYSIYWSNIINFVST